MCSNHIKVGGSNPCVFLYTHVTTLPTCACSSSCAGNPCQGVVLPAFGFCPLPVTLDKLLDEGWIDIYQSREKNSPCGQYNCCSTEYRICYTELWNPPHRHFISITLGTLPIPAYVLHLSILSDATALDNILSSKIPLAQLIWKLWRGALCKTPSIVRSKVVHLILPQRRCLKMLPTCLLLLSCIICELPGPQDPFPIQH